MAIAPVRQSNESDADVASMSEITYNGAPGTILNGKMVCNKVMFLASSNVLVKQCHEI
jgi:hypothetical protein